MQQGKTFCVLVLLASAFSFGQSSSLPASPPGRSKSKEFNKQLDDQISQRLKEGERAYIPCKVNLEKPRLTFQQRQFVRISAEIDARLLQQDAVQRELVEQRLAPFIGELQAPSQGQGTPGEFFLRNQNFEAVDAELLYGIIRAMRPARVIELGSGYTSLLINLACRHNTSSGVSAVHHAFDPYPREHILGAKLPAPSSRLSQ